MSASTIDEILPLRTYSSDLRASISGKDLPEDIKSRLLALHEENVNLKESVKTVQEKLTKAKAVRFASALLSLRICTYFRLTQFIKSQDKLFKEQHTAVASSAPVSLWFMPSANILPT